VVAEHLLLHPWLDNLRGIERLVQRLLSFGPPSTVGMQLLREVMPEFGEGTGPPSPAPSGAASAAPALQDAASAPISPAPQAQPTREEFVAVYEAMGRNVRAVAKHFGRDRRQVYRWLEAFGIER